LQCTKYTQCGTISTHLLTEAGRSGLLYIISPYTYVGVTAKRYGTYTMMHKYYHSNSSADKKNHDAWTHEWRESGVIKNGAMEKVLNYLSYKMITALYIRER
jgi:hypothetical protein